MKSKCLVIFAFLFLSYFSGVCIAGDWKQDFENMCGKTETAESMSDAELSTIITECERVKKEAEESKDPQKKVFLFRIKKCLNFYIFMQQTRDL